MPSLLNQRDRLTVRKPSTSAADTAADRTRTETNAMRMTYMGLPVIVNSPRVATARDRNARLSLSLNCKVGPAARVSVAGVQRDLQMVIWEIPGSSRHPRFRSNRVPDAGSQNWNRSSIQTNRIKNIVGSNRTIFQSGRDTDTHDENQTNCRDWHHDGRWDVAKAMVREAAANGATLAKFQTYTVG